MKINQIILSILIAINFFEASAQTKNQQNDREFTTSLIDEKSTFITTGRNMYFILDPGYRLFLRGIEGRDTVTLTITVLDETKMIGDIETRVVEEREVVNGTPVEISRNFFAFCKENASIYYFGEEVDIYKNGKLTGHEGAWMAGGDNKPGLMMPGLVLLGSRYFQEIAPKIAMDRAEIISMSETMQTPAGNFSNVLKTEETTPIEPREKEYKYYAPGVGLIKDDNLVLVKYGFTD